MSGKNQSFKEIREALTVRSVSAREKYMHFKTEVKRREGRSKNKNEFRFTEYAGFIANLPVSEEPLFYLMMI